MAQVQVERSWGALRGEEETHDNLGHHDCHNQAAVRGVFVGVPREKVEGLSLIQRRQEQGRFCDFFSILSNYTLCLKKSWTKKWGRVVPKAEFNVSLKGTKPRRSCDSLNKSTASSSSDVTVIPKNKTALNVSFGDTLARHGFRMIQI